MMSQSKRVRDFNKQVGEALPNEPTMLSRGEDPRTADYFGEKLAGISEQMKGAYAAGYGGLVTFRAALILEEIAELLQAKTLEDQVDALVDADIYSKGAIAFMGVDPDPIFHYVMNANEAKIWPDGTIHRDERGKWTKPPGWEENHAPEPLIRLALQLQAEHAAKAKKLNGVEPDLIIVDEMAGYVMSVDLAKNEELLECQCGLCEKAGGCEEPSE